MLCRITSIACVPCGVCVYGDVCCVVTSVIAIRTHTFECRIAARTHVEYIVPHLFFSSLEAHLVHNTLHSSCVRDIQMIADVVVVAPVYFICHFA